MKYQNNKILKLKVKKVATNLIWRGSVVGVLWPPRRSVVVVVVMVVIVVMVIIVVICHQFHSILRLFKM